MQSKTNWLRNAVTTSKKDIDMKKYTKKPVTIEAIQWNGNNLKEVIDFIGLHESASKWTWEEYEEVVKNEGLKIFTKEGAMMASVGDWVIKEPFPCGDRDFYPCKPDIFTATYDATPSFSDGKSSN